MIAALLLAGSALAAAADSRADFQGDKALLAPPPIHWFKTYSLSPYREFWSLTLGVNRLDSGVAQVREAFAKEGAQLTQAFEGFPSSATDGTQQLSYKLTGKAAKAVLKRLGKLGALGAPVVRPSMEPVPLDEVKEKLKRLRTEKGIHAKELAAMPAVSALVEEAVDHLQMVRSVREGSAPEVLLNLTVRETR